MKSKTALQLGALVLTAMAAVVFFASTDARQRDELMESNVESKAQILGGLIILNELFANSNQGERGHGPLCEMSDAIVTECGTNQFLLALSMNGNNNSELAGILSGEGKATGVSTSGSANVNVNIQNNNNKGFTATVNSNTIVYHFTNRYERYCLYRNTDDCRTVINGQDCAKQYQDAAKILKEFVRK